MKLDYFLNQRSYLAVSIFLIAVFTAFYPSYYSILGHQPQIYNHLHGISMTFWVSLLIVQPLLISLKLRGIHKILGYSSYVLFPMILVSIILLLRYNMQGVSLQNDFILSFQALVLVGAAAFALLYLLAIHNRKKTDIHARYMISTLFPIITPVTDRLISRYCREWIPFAPTIGGNPILPFFGFLLADSLILLLLLWDWKSNKRLDVFPKVLLILLGYHISVFSFYKFEWWYSFSSWVVSL